MFFKQTDLKRLRELIGFSQQQVAEYCNTTRFFVTKAETTGDVEDSIIKKLNDFYGTIGKALWPYFSKDQKQEICNMELVNKI